jgi:Fic family protein
MRKSDLSINRQKQLVPVPEHSGAFAVVPPPTPRSINSKTILNEVTKAHEALGSLRVSTERLSNPDLVTRTLDRREAVRSSQIEGTNSGMNQLFTFEATGSEEGLPPDVVVTASYVKALEYGLKEIRGGAQSFVSCKLIKDIHQHLMKDYRDYRGAIGEFRESQNWIAGLNIYQAKFVPPPASYVKGCMAELETYLSEIPREEDMYEVPIVIRMAIAHAQFETIHPFIDGNGRVGRLMLPLMLAAEGYPPVYVAGFLKANQQEYYDGLAGVQLREEWEEWVRFFATAVEESCQTSIQTAVGLNEILGRWESTITGLRLRSDSAVNQLPKLLIGTPVVSVRQVVTGLGVSFPAANNALAKLVEMGILTIPQEQQRDRIFIAEEVLTLLDRS